MIEILNGAFAIKEVVIKREAVDEETPLHCALCLAKPGLTPKHVAAQGWLYNPFLRMLVCPACYPHVYPRWEKFFGLKGAPNNATSQSAADRRGPG